MKKIVLILSVLLFTVATRAQIAPVVISEVLYDTPLDEHWYADYFGGPYFNGEFIELFNPTRATVDISGWRLRDGDSFIGFTFPAGSRIAARSAVLVAFRHPKSPSFSLRELFPEITPAQEQTAVYYHSDIRLTNDGDILELLTDKGDLVDRVSWLSARGSKDPHMAHNWTLQARNGEGLSTQRKLQSLQRTNIHASSSRIDFLQEDYETAEASPLRIPAHYGLPVLTEFYRSGDLNTSLPVGTLPGEAAVTPTGAATYRIPIEVPPGTNGRQPQLAIAYNSQGGAGALGQGWDLAGLSVISRGTQSFYHDGSTLESATVRFDSSDRLYMDGQRLILLSGTYWGDGSVYGFEQENRVRVTLKKKGGDMYFEASYPGGNVVRYGSTADSRVRNAANANDSRTLAWKADRATDVHGNETVYTYTGGGMYLSAVEYTGGENRLEFRYAVNPKNARKRYIKDFLTEQNRLLSAIDVRCGGRKVRGYTFGYTTSDTDLRLESINEEIGGEKLNATKIAWGEDVPLQTFRAGACGDKGLANSDNAFLYTGDIDGDGYTDKIEVWTGSEYSKEHGYEAGYFRVILKGDRALPGVSIQSYTENHPFFIPKLVVGDVNGDGKDEITLIEREELKMYAYNQKAGRMDNTETHSIVERDWQTNWHYRYNAFLTNANHDEYPDMAIVPYVDPGFVNDKSYCVYSQGDMEVVYGGGNGSAMRQETESVRIGNLMENKKNADIWHAPLYGDFNADGAWDILKPSACVSNSFDNKIFRFFETTAWNECLFWIQYPDGAANLMPRFSRIYPMDYDADGYTDLLVRGTEDYDYEWYFLKNNQGAFNAPTKVDVDLHRPIDREEGEMSDVFFLDYNGDGWMDIVVADETFVKKKKEKVFSHHDFLFYKNVNGSFVKEGYSYQTTKRVMKMRPVVMDANGDGVADLVFTDGTDYTAIGKPDLYKRNMVHKITNGLGQTHSFTYNIYSDYDQSPAADPVRNLKAPLPVVAEHVNPAGQATAYTYKDGKVHKHKGFLGFLNVSAQNGTTRTETRCTYAIDPVSYTLLPQKQETLIAGTPVATAEHQYETVTINAARKRFLTRLKRETVTDRLKDIAQQTDHAYTDASGTKVSKTAKQLNGNVVSVTEFFDYRKYKGNDLPGRVKVTARHTGQDDITAETSYEYDGNGLLKKKTEYPGTEAEVQTEYGYYPVGNLHSVKTTPKGCDPQTVTYRYDALYRFAEETVNTLGQVSRASHDPATGNVLAESGIDGLETVYEYDSRGRLRRTTCPNGETVSHTRSWCDEHGATCKTEAHNETLNTRTVTYYDHLGRRVYTEETGADGSLLASSQTYNALGLVARSVPPRAADGPERYTEYEYDSFGRVRTERCYDGENTLTTGYAYAGRTTTVTRPDGTRSSATEDEAGRVIRREDEGGAIVYEHNAAGQPVSVTSNGVTTRIEYDAAGRQTALHDPDAGTMRYRYRADGQLLLQVTARGDSTVMEYDKAGRPKTETIHDKQTGGVTVTTYAYKDSGNGVGQTESVTMQVNGETVHAQAFLYDGWHRPVRVIDTYEGEEYWTRWDYDELWRPLKSVSPSGLVVTNEYDERGNVKRVKAGNVVVWELTGMTPAGQITSFRLGNGAEAVHEHYGNGLLKSQYVQHGGVTVQHMEYEYDAETYSLTRRNNRKQNRDEWFGYDALDRLTLTAVNRRVGYPVRYHDNGNIDSKPDVGTYLYDPTARPHALAGIKDGTAGSGLTGIEQEITYTAFNKVSSVQHHRGNNDRYEIQYGPDRQRIKTTYYTNGKRRYDRYYFGTYELDVCPEGHRTHTDYIYTPGGLTAIFKRTFVSEALYYVTTDHMGSIQAITDAEGELQAEYRYEPWGGRVLTAGDNTLTDRGYTGHEHLEPLGLINMNGRIYDPTLARFLSPDPYVQAPDFTQGFNRYSYCLNNPFKYTDPSGENPVLIAVMMAAIINVTVQGMSGNINSAEDFWLAAGIGALGGLAGGLAGQAVGAAIGSATTFWGSVAQGAAVGATASGTGSFVTSAGNAWMNGADFVQGLTAGAIGLGIGAVSGGIIGGVSGGIQYSKIAHQFNITIDDVQMDGKKVVYSNKNAKAFQEYYFGEQKGLNNLYADGTLPPSGNLEGGATVPIGDKMSDVYLSEKSFSNKFRLFNAMGHEFVHVAQNYQGLTTYTSTGSFMEVGAYLWNKRVYEMAGIEFSAAYQTELNRHIDIVSTNLRQWLGKNTLPVINDYFYNSLSTFKVLRYVW